MRFCTIKILLLRELHHNMIGVSVILKMRYGFKKYINHFFYWSGNTSLKRFDDELSKEIDVSLITHNVCFLYDMYYLCTPHFKMQIFLFACDASKQCRNTYSVIGLGKQGLSANRWGEGCSLTCWGRDEYLDVLIYVWWNYISMH